MVRYKILLIVTEKIDQPFLDRCRLHSPFIKDIVILIQLISASCAESKPLSWSLHHSVLNDKLIQRLEVYKSVLEAVNY